MNALDKIYAVLISLAILWMLIDIAQSLEKIATQLGLIAGKYIGT